MQLIVRLHRWSHLARNRGLRPLSRLIDGVSRLLFAAAVPGRARIAKSVHFHHSGLGVVINGASVIEDDCEIGVHVVLGGKTPLAGAPHLEKGVIVHAGAQIIGPIRIGAGSVIAANAVVLDDVPANSMVAGIPAIVKRSAIDSRLYRHAAPADHPCAAVLLSQ